MSAKLLNLLFICFVIGNGYILKQVKGQGTTTISNMYVQLCFTNWGLFSHSQIHINPGKHLHCTKNSSCRSSG